MLDLVLGERRRWELPVAAAVVLLATVAFASQSFFFADDLFFPAWFRENPPTVEALTRSWFGHLMPAYIASLIGFLAVFGMSWPAAAVIIGLIHTGAFVALVRIVDAVVGTRRMAVLAGVAFALSIGPLALRLWWAASLNNVFALAVSLAALGCLTRFVVHRRWRSLAAGLALYALALASSEKSLLFSVHILLWCLLVVWRGTPLRHRARQLLRTWPVWVGIFVLSMVDVVAFLTGPYLAESGESPTLTTTLEFLANSVFGGLMPSFLGFDLFYASRVPDLLHPAVLLAAAVFAVVVVASVVLVRSNGGVWLFALAVVLANNAVLSRRADIIGVGAGRELRYQLENSALVWMALGVVLFTSLVRLRELGVGRRVELRPQPTLARLAPTVAGIVAAGALVVVSAMAWSGSLARTVDKNHGLDARAWVEAMQGTLPPESTRLVDSPVPSPIALGGLWPYNMASAVIPVFGPQPEFTDVLEDSWVVGDDGTAGPAVLHRRSIVSTAAQCLEQEVDLAYPSAKAFPGRFLVIEYSNSAAGAVGVFAGGIWTMLDRPAGSGTLVMHLPFGVEEDELVVSPDGPPVCIDSVSFADVVPATD
ncbi:MAG: hypothetical protein Q7T71_07800 [Herbiconiux sp.]|nr:hypothetical protein [Herbiconiux sp.]